MPAGLQVWNNGTFIQIDSEYTNYALLQKATVSLNASGPIHYFGGYADITVSSVAIVAVTSTSKICLESITVSGANRVFRYRSTVLGASMTYYVFVPSNFVAPATNYGFEVFRADGSLAFSSGHNYMRVVFFEGWPYYEEHLGPVTLPGGRSYAVVMSSPTGFFIREVFDDAGSQYVIEDVTNNLYVSISGNTYYKTSEMSRLHTWYSNNSEAMGSSGIQTMSLLLLDVTGF